MATVEEKNHDSSTTVGDHYDTINDPDGAASVIAGAALDGSTYGLRADYDAGTNGFQLSDSLTFSADELTLRVLLKFDNLTGLNNNNAIGAVALRDSSPVTFIFDIVFTSTTGGAIEAKAGYRSDSGATLVFTSNYSVPTTGEVCVEIRAVKETADTNADGILKFYIDSVLKEEITNADNFNNFNNIDQTYYNFNSNVSAFGGSFDLDEWILDDSASASLGCSSVSGSNEFRFLGFAADTGTLMVSGLKDGGTLQLFDYPLDTLTESGTASFGAGTDAELDARTRGIFPVAKPMADDVWYLYGRDGSNVQVQYNDRNGTLGWVDLSPGTASWGSSKYAVGLWPSSTSNDNIIVGFSDDDVWRTLFGTFSWVQMGDADTGDLRAGARMITNRANELVLAGASAGSVLYSPDSGATFADVSGTALGVINAIEVSL
jgi:hypothetical protein